LTGRNLKTITLDPNAVLVPGKRRGYSDFVGTLKAETEFGDTLIVEYLDNRPHEVCQVQIQKGGVSWTVDEVNLTLTKSIPGGKNTGSPIETPLQSNLTHVSLDYLENGLKPAWAPLEISLVLHQKLHNALLNHLGSGSKIYFT
jgi:hypothetical protein